MRDGFIWKVAFWGEFFEGDDPRACFFYSTEINTADSGEFVKWDESIWITVYWYPVLPDYFPLFSIQTCQRN